MVVFLLMFMLMLAIAWEGQLSLYGMRMRCGRARIGGFLWYDRRAKT